MKEFCCTIVGVSKNVQFFYFIYYFFKIYVIILGVLCQIVCVHTNNREKKLQVLELASLISFFKNNQSWW